MLESILLVIWWMKKGVYRNWLTLQVLHHVFLLLPLVFLLELSSNLFFPYNNIPWFGLCCPSLRKKRRWQALQFWFWVIPPPSHSQPRAKELHLGVYFFSWSVQIFSRFISYLLCSHGQNGLFWANFSNALFQSKTLIEARKIFEFSRQKLGI